MSISLGVTINELLSVSVPEELPLAIFESLHEQFGFDFEVHAGKVQFPFSAIRAWASAELSKLQTEGTERSVS